MVLPIKTEYKELKKDTNEYEQFEAKARLNLINKIYQSHDSNLNEKYKVELTKEQLNELKFILMRINTSFNDFKKNILKKTSDFI